MFMIKRFSMKIIQFQFYFYAIDLLMWSRNADTLTDRLTDLGHNVTINCDLHEEEVYWFLLKLPDPPVMILCTFSSPFYYNKQFIPKYSVQSKHNLFINNVTYDELGVYYCMSPDTTSEQFSNGSRLHIFEVTEKQNNTVMNVEQSKWLVMSALMNGVLLIVVIGLLKMLVCGSKGTGHNSKTSSNDLQRPQVMDNEQNSEQTQYAEVDLPTQPSCPTLCKPIHFNSTYALVQLPKSQT